MSHIRARDQLVSNLFVLQYRKTPDYHREREMRGEASLCRGLIEHRNWQ